MKRTKMVFVPAIALALVFALSACGSDSYDSAAGGQIATLETVLGNPAGFADSQLTLEGFVANVSARFFYVRNETGTAELMVDFRGNQAFPSEGEKIAVRGNLVQNCCDPNLFMLMSFGFEHME